MLDCLRAIQTFDYQPRVGVEQGMDSLSKWAKELGGPQAICKLARTPAGEEDATRHARLADESR